MWRRAALLGVTGLMVVVGAVPAHAVTDRWAAWSPIAGAANNYATQMQQQAPGFPVADVVSDSRAPVALASGASTFLGPATPPGAAYGSSAGQPYLVLRPRADAPLAPSTTTYTFDEPTPDTGWAFVLGDIDADQVRITATDAAGRAVSEAQVSSWFAGVFNYAGASELPSWDATTSTLVGNPGAVDTDGASGWFEPDIALTALTLTFTRRAGFPVYQTWFVSRARPIGGTVTDADSCAPDAAVAHLLSPAGTTLATTRPDATGSYSFGEYATQAGYVVRLDPPPGCVVVGSAHQTVSNRGEDDAPASRANFVVQAAPQQPPTTTADVDLVLHKRATNASPIRVGQTVRYALRVRNKGADDARGPVRLTDALPRGLELVSANGQGWRCQVRHRADVVSCELRRDLRADRTAPPVRITATATARAVGRVTNRARVQGSHDSSRANNSDTASVTVIPAQLPATGFRRPATGSSLG